MSIDDEVNAVMTEWEEAVASARTERDNRLEGERAHRAAFAEVCDSVVLPALSKVAGVVRQRGSEVKVDGMLDQKDPAVRLRILDGFEATLTMTCRASSIDVQLGDQHEQVSVADLTNPAVVEQWALTTVRDAFPPDRAIEAL